MLTRRRLALSNLIANTGQGDLRLRPEHDAATGITTGFQEIFDQYHQSTEGQELEVTGAKPGIYYLVSTANPDANFLETTTTNNTAWTSFRLSRDSKGNAKIAEVAHSACSGTLCGEDIPNR